MKVYVPRTVLLDGREVEALVPIEAEEETTGALVNRVGEIRWEESRRLVTPWTPTEEA